jgi:hypothetical protein
MQPSADELPQHDDVALEQDLWEEHFMHETFEAVIFARSAGAWSIVARQAVPGMVDGVAWARASVVRLGETRSYQRFRARIISSTDDQSAEQILRSLRS